MVPARFAALRADYLERVLGGLVALDIVDADVGPLLGQEGRDSPSDAATRPRNQRLLAF